MPMKIRFVPKVAKIRKTGWRRGKAPSLGSNIIYFLVRNVLYELLLLVETLYLEWLLSNQRYMCFFFNFFSFVRDF